MILSHNYEVVEITGEVLAVPVGDFAKTNKDVFTFTNAAAFLLKKMKTPISDEEMVTFLVSEFDVDTATAQVDVHRFVNELLSLGLIDN